jgi:hypothetical protein
MATFKHGSYEENFANYDQLRNENIFAKKILNADLCRTHDDIENASKKKKYRAKNGNDEYQFEVLNNYYRANDGEHICFSECYAATSPTGQKSYYDYRTHEPIREPVTTLDDLYKVEKKIEKEKGGSFFKNLFKKEQKTEPNKAEPKRTNPRDIEALKCAYGKDSTIIDNGNDSFKVTNNGKTYDVEKAMEHGMTVWKETNSPGKEMSVNSNSDRLKSPAPDVKENEKSKFAFSKNQLQRDQNKELER